MEEYTLGEPIHQEVDLTEVRVSVVTRSYGEIALGDTAVAIPPEPAVLSVTGYSDRRIRLDGNDRRLSGGVTGVLAVDYTRSTGYHRLDVDNQIFWFTTQDRKLRLDGVEQMLYHLRNLGTGWNGQALFSDGSGYLDPHVLYGWFDANGDEALSAIETILLAPRAQEITSHAVSRRGGSSVLVRPTTRFVRSDPHRNAVEQEGGLIKINGKNFTPTRVIVRRRERTVDTVPNRRAVHLLRRIRELLSELLHSSVTGTPQGRCRLWRERANRLASQPLAIQLRVRPSAMGLPRHTVEFTDRTYARIFDLAESLGNFGWSASAKPMRCYSYIESADRIYQAYVAHRVASALGLSPTPGVFRSGELAFTGTEFDLYYDCEPPLHVLSSWRAHTAVPDASKPDLLLQEKATGRVAVLDAKYRFGGNGLVASRFRCKSAGAGSGFGG
jgi:hypothetical protein